MGNKILRVLFSITCALGFGIAFAAVGHDDYAMRYVADGFSFKATLAQMALGFGLSAASYGLRAMVIKEDKEEK